MDSSIQPNEAKRLFGRLRGALLNLDSLLSEIVTTKAWEPLGYASFAEAWAAELGDVKLTGRMLAAVAYTMFDCGSSAEDVATTVTGLGPKKTEALHTAYVRGLPADKAEQFMSKMTSTSGRRIEVPARTVELEPGETFVAAHVRGASTRRNSVTLEGFSDDEIVTWKATAEAAGLPYRTWLRDLLRDAANTASGVES